MVTTVINLRTQKEYVYCLPPKEAVVAAFRQIHLKDYNWWVWRPAQEIAVETGKHFYFCGDFAAKKEK